MKTKIKLLFFLNLIIAGFPSCDSVSEKEISELETKIDYQKDTGDCDCNQIEMRRASDGNPIKGEEHIMFKAGNKFTGKCTVKQFDDKSNKEYRQYKNGLLDGTYYSWHENGKSRLKIDFIKGFIHGKFEEWDETGKEIANLSYNQGRLSGSSYYFLLGDYDKEPRHRIFLSDEKFEETHSMVWKSDFEDNFKGYKKEGNYIVKIERKVNYGKGNVLIYKNDRLDIDPDRIKNLNDLNSFLDFAKKFANEHKQKINITDYHPSIWRYFTSNVYGDYYWTSVGNGTPKKQEIDDKIYQKFIDKKIGFDPAFMKAFTNGVKESTDNNDASVASDLFEDDVSDEDYDYTR